MEMKIILSQMSKKKKKESIPYTADESMHKTSSLAYKIEF